MNPTGEVKIRANGREWTLKLTWGALAKMQSDLGLDQPDAIMGSLKPTQLPVILKGLLAGGGHHLSDTDMLELDIEDDPETLFEKIQQAFVQSRIANFQRQEGAGKASENPTT